MPTAGAAAPWPASGLKEAVGEITAAAKWDSVLAGEGIVALSERLWPALENIDASSDAPGPPYTARST